MEIGRSLASSQKTVSEMPFYLQIGKRHWPLDRTAREYMEIGYCEAGGMLERVQNIPLRYDVVAPFERFMVVPAELEYSLRESQNLMRRDMEQSQL